MNNANLYKKSNVLQKRDAKEIIEEFSSIFNWKWDGSSDALLDIGCGSGDVLYELILPKIPINIEVIGIDISKEMIKYANEHYGNEYLKFYKVDIESEMFIDGKTTPIKPESFNFITSFYALHWIQNQRQALSNIHKLLKPNGTCLLVFLVSNPIYDVYTHLSRMKKYSRYMSDVEKFISPYHYEEKPLEVFESTLTHVGFKISHIEIRDQIFIYENVDLLKYSVAAVNPFTKRMPESLQNEFLNDYVKKIDDLNLIRFNENTFTKDVFTPYKLMIAVINK
ncbi:hypothetical protein PVAND_004631 [Polypedilum vanderplanki]|uniref:Methyltransferase domain-containing protein n=1 Tax=Polypedilum vanderplanki TaxID=319348 RepID=A0A9J6BXT0_POLVA|nr:hypothetical protein PVAND_004631 [Polypedilum vanderplanki]